MKEIKTLAQVRNVLATSQSILIIKSHELIIDSIKIKIEEGDCIEKRDEFIIKTNSAKKEIYILQDYKFQLLSQNFTSVQIKNYETYILIDFDYENSCTNYRAKIYNKIYNFKTNGFNGVLFFNSELLVLNNILNKKEILCITYENQTLWNNNLNEESKIYGDIHIYRDILVVPQEDDQNKITMTGLDIMSGKTLWQIKTSLAYYKKKDNKLYGFASNSFGDNFYSEINIQTGEVFEKNIEGYNKNVVSHLATIHNDYLYYAVYKNNCEIGVIDLKSKDIINEYPLNLGRGIQIGAPVITDDKIYILDSNNTLHIYEKEESIL